MKICDILSKLVLIAFVTSPFALSAEEESTELKEALRKAQELRGRLKWIPDQGWFWTVAEAKARLSEVLRLSGLAQKPRQHLESLKLKSAVAAVHQEPGTRWIRWDACPPIEIVHGIRGNRFSGFHFQRQ